MKLYAIAVTMMVCGYYLAEVIKYAYRGSIRSATKNGLIALALFGLGALLMSA